MIAIVDYGMGNLHSVQKALEYVGVEAIVTDKVEAIEKAKKIILPGVGAFEDAIRELENKDLIEVLRNQIKTNKPFLGICLGMQLLFQTSQEAEDTIGLGILKGKVLRFASLKGIKIPHIGWNQIILKRRDCPLLTDIEDEAYVYFCHSYYPQPEDKSIVAATCEYGIEFGCVIWKDNIYGVQFHPEKSQKIGLKIIKNFVDLC